MSPRSAEFFMQRVVVWPSLASQSTKIPPVPSVWRTTYSMLYAARAALSERDEHGKTHTGTWRLFRERLVESGAFDAELAAEAQQVQREREQADYEAWAAPADEARRVIELAGSFLAAVQSLLDDGD